MLPADPAIKGNPVPFIHGCEHWLEPKQLSGHDFLNLRKNTGSEEERCRDLFLAMWINDLFMQRVQEDGMWSQMHRHGSQ
jgi:hypothetical protein